MDIQNIENRVDDKFYRDQYQKLLMDKLEAMEQKIDAQAIKLNSVDSKVNYMYAWAAGAAFIGAFVVAYIKDRITKYL